MKRFCFPVLSLFLLLSSITSSAQRPSMTSWVSRTSNETTLSFRIHDEYIDNGYALCEVSLDMSAARCALTQSITLSIHENDGVGTYGTERYTVTFNPGNGSSAFSMTERTRILIHEIAIEELVYARIEVTGVDRLYSFDLSTPNCLTSQVYADAYDPHNSFISAVPLSDGSSISGLVINANEDYFRVTISDSEPRLTFTIRYWDDYRTDISDLNLGFRVCDETTDVIATVNSYSTSTSHQIEEVFDEVVPPGDYYFRVGTGESDARNFYDLEVRMDVDPDRIISGQVTQIPGGSAMEGVTLTGLPGDPVTDASGHYEAVVPVGWSGTVTPTLTGYHFTPSSFTHTNVTTDLTQDYSAEINTYEISGYVLEPDGTPIIITFYGFPEPTGTHLDGFYSATVPHGWSGQVWPVSNNYEFTPPIRNYSNIGGDQSNQDYEGFEITYPIMVRTIDNGSVPISDVHVFGEAHPQVTDADGEYVIVMAYGTFIAFQPEKEGYTFSPEYYEIPFIHEPVSPLHFIGTLNTYEITGNISLSGGGTSSGVTLSGLPGDPVSDGSGNYSATVDHGWSGTVIPVLEGYTFTPESRTYSDLSQGLSSENYLATPVTPAVSGRVTDEVGQGVEGVTLVGFPTTVLTDADGYYSTTVPYDWTGTIFPDYAGLDFTPVIREYSHLQTDIGDQDYTGSITMCFVHGFTLVSGTGEALPGVLLDGSPGQLVTDVNGYYYFEVPYGSDVSLTPVLANYEFAPPVYTIENIGTNYSADFEGSLVTNIIWGIVEDALGTGLGGVQMAGLPGNPLTLDGSGHYYAYVEHGWSGTATPELDGYSFSPVSTTYSNVTSETQTDYIATILPYLNVNQHLILLGAEAGADSPVAVTSNVDWTVSCPAGWITCAPASGSDDGSFTVTANLANTGTASRATTVTVAGGGITRTIDITQAGSDPFLGVSSSAVTLTAPASSSQTVDITSNIAWTVSETADWLSVTPVGGSGNAGLTLTADLANESLDPRSTTVTVTGSGITRNIEVTQAGAAPVLDLSSATVSLAAASASSQTLDITSNTDWTVSEVVNWLSVTPVSGSGNESLIFTADLANETVDSRSTTVTVSGGGLTRTIVVSQSGTEAILEVSATTVSLGANVGVDQTVIITSNIGWTASESSDWLTVSPLSGTSDGIITISATSANEEITSRSSTVTVAGGGITHSIEVTQEGATPTLGADAPSENLGAAAGSFLNLNIYANISWTATLDAEWLSVSPSSGTGDQVVTILANSTNTAETERTATLTLEGGGMMRTMTITQDGTDYTGMDPFAQIKLELYPNPSRDYVYLRSCMELPEEVRIEVLSTSGRVLSLMQLPALIPDEPVQIDLSSYPAGQYLIRVGNERIQRVLSIIKTQ